MAVWHKNGIHMAYAYFWKNGERLAYHEKATKKF